ncbi:MAG: aspartate kinase [Methanosphaera sp.]|uniref:aspartate kinase n=1 Tax=Methanosphaera sp. TaxID=2666342 RepID=UPI0025DBB299|nr:aspartate kinase [Methanosphaera sp.]MCI5867652.1 aspartate kinase [Methanosphaera sp.]MDD6534120.1 aspartate kinase [Methanosphaera sp.]MDY3956071.1 aspartate kinase [Methanosphaera sp.]
MATVVAKFGGTSVGTGERIQKAAKSVVNEYMQGNKVIVVVSAINKTTDESIKLVNESMGDLVTDKQLAGILSMGEMQSVRIMAATIESLGVKAEYIDPFSEKWPVITDSNFTEAKIDKKATEEKVKQHIKKLVDQGIIPVICGFLGRDSENNVTTLGRGGSDVSAFLIGQCIGADEVVIVTDVKGVMSTDPRKLNTARKLDKITVEEMIDLANYGAQVLHPNALRYKDPSIKAKIISFEYGNLRVQGTDIIGPANPDEDIITITKLDDQLAVLAVVGENLMKKQGIIAEIAQLVNAHNFIIYGISTGESSITLFFKYEDAIKAHEILHQAIIEGDTFSSISLGQKIAMISLVSHDFIDTPGIIASITKPLHENNINIVELSSSQTAVVVFVDWENGEKAYKLIKETLV